MESQFKIHPNFLHYIDQEATEIAPHSIYVEKGGIEKARLTKTFPASIVWAVKNGFVESVKFYEQRTKRRGDRGQRHLAIILIKKNKHCEAVQILSTMNFDSGVMAFITSDNKIMS